MTENLLPCPFCGGEAKLHDGLINIVPVIDEYGAYIDADLEGTPAWVECTACGAAADGFDDADEAVAAWNRRAILDGCENELIARCENCKHYNRIGCSDGFGWCESMDRGVSDDFYCANGAKMEDKS